MKLLPLRRPEQRVQKALKWGLDVLHMLLLVSGEDQDVSEQTVNQSLEGPHQVLVMTFN